MTSSLDFSPIEDWIAAARFAVRRDDDATVIYTNPGGEVRIYIREVDGVYDVSEAERSGDERFKFSTRELDLLLKFLTLELGGAVRFNAGLPLQSVPSLLEDLPSGFEIETPNPDVDVLLESGVPVASLESGSGLYPAVEFALVARASLSQIKESFLAADGAPLLLRS